jgi:hypothetical protein
MPRPQTTLRDHLSKSIASTLRPKEIHQCQMVNSAKKLNDAFQKSERKKGEAGRNDRYWYYEGIRFSVDEIGGEKTDDATLLL